MIIVYLVKSLLMNDSWYHLSAVAVNMKLAVDLSCVTGKSTSMRLKLDRFYMSQNDQGQSEWFLELWRSLSFLWDGVTMVSIHVEKVSTDPDPWSHSWRIRLSAFTCQLCFLQDERLLQLRRSGGILFSVDCGLWCIQGQRNIWILMNRWQVNERPLVCASVRVLLSPPSPRPELHHTMREFGLQKAAK